MTTVEGPPAAPRPATRLTPEQVRTARFQRSPLGKRGYSDEAVERFARRLAEEIAARDTAEASLRSENDRLKRALRQWQADQRAASSEQENQGHATPAPANPPVVDAINLLSHAQQQADAQLAQTQVYCRQLTAEARSRADAILQEAQTRADATATAAAQRESSKIDLDDDRLNRLDPIDVDEIERRLRWARSFLAALQSAESQLSTAREALSFEVEKIAEIRSPLPGRA